MVLEVILPTMLCFAISARGIFTTLLNISDGAFMKIGTCFLMLIIFEKAPLWIFNMFLNMPLATYWYGEIESSMTETI